MKIDDYNRVRRYEKVMTAWVQVNSVLDTTPLTNEQQPEVEELLRARSLLQVWLTREMAHFTSIIEY